MLTGAACGSDRVPGVGGDRAGGRGVHVLHVAGRAEGSGVD